MRARLSSSWRAALGLAVLVLALFRDLVFRGRVLFDRDVYVFWFGQVEAFRHSVWAGSWPLWDRTTAFGQPLLANPSVQAFYPWMWLSLFMDPWSFFTVFVVGHFIVSAIGFFLLGRRLGLGHAAAVVGAAVWILSGPVVSFANLWHHFAGTCLIPWVVLGAEVALSSALGYGALVWGAASGLQLLAGSADLCMLTILPTAIVILRHVAWRRSAWRANASILATAALAAALAGALGAAQWFPTLALALDSLRLGRLAEVVRTSWSVHPRALLGLALPVFPGELPLGGDPAFALESFRPFVASLYLGLVAIPLALAALGGPRRRRAWAAAAFVLGLLLMALGRHTPFYALVLRLLPFLASFRYPSKATTLVAFGWAMLVAFGVERLQTNDARARRGVAASAAALALFAAVLAFAARSSLASILGPAAGRLAITATLALLLAALAWWGRRRGASPAFALALGALAVADLFAAHQALNITTERAAVTSVPEVVQTILASPAPRRLYVFDYFDIVGKTYRRPSGAPLLLLRDQSAVGTFRAFRDYTNPSITRAWGIGGSFENDPLGLYPGYLTQLVMMIRVWEESPAFLKVLRMAGVGHVVALHTEGLEDLIPERIIPGGFVVPVRMYRVPDPLPRCRVAAAGPVAADSHQQFVIMGDERFDPAVEVLFPPGTVPRTPRIPVHGICRALEIRPDRARYEVELDAPGYVALADTYAPEWRARIDGRPAELVRANIVFQAVAAPAGKHVLELAYRPASFVAGLWVSGTALLVLAGGGVVAFARRRGAARDTIVAVPTRES
jgi:hypothetical protein